MSAETYDPKLFIDGYADGPGSVFVQTSLSTDLASMPLQTAMGWAQTSLGDDVATTPRELGFQIVQDTWV